MVSMPWERLEQPTCLPKASQRLRSHALPRQAVTAAHCDRSKGFKETMWPASTVPAMVAGQRVAGKNHWETKGA